MANEKEPMARAGLRIKSALETFRIFIAPVAQLLAVVGVLVGVAVWGYKLQDRVNKLEAVVQTIATSPPSPTANGEPQKNPVVGACETLAERFASASTSSYPAESGLIAIRSMMNDLGCFKKN